jgi:metallo-beta-lactamase class B
MQRYLVPLLSVGLLFATDALAQGNNANAQAHLAAARALAYEPGHDYTGSFEVICAQPQPAAPRGDGARGAGGGGGQRGAPPRAQWYAEPAKLFDNLYFVGADNDSAYALTTSEGIILLNTVPDYAAEAEIVEGMKKLGLDPAKIKYVVIADARNPSYGGVRYLQDHYQLRVLSSEADWNVMAKTNVPETSRPKKDMVVTDGQKLTLGDTTITLYVTPGHTPGTISMIIPVKDGNQRHVAALLGGRDPLVNGEGVQYFPTILDATKQWKTSVNRFRDIAAKAGADVFLITRGQNDRLPDKIRALKYRKPGAPHPFVHKDAVKRYLNMTSECMDAQMAWRSGS